MHNFPFLHMVSVGNCSSVILTLEANNAYLSVAKHGYSGILNVSQTKHPHLWFHIPFSLYS